MVPGPGPQGGGPGTGGRVARGRGNRGGRADGDGTDGGGRPATEHSAAGDVSRSAPVRGPLLRAGHRPAALGTGRRVLPPPRRRELRVRRQRRPAGGRPGEPDRQPAIAGRSGAADTSGGTPGGGPAS